MVFGFSSQSKLLDLRRQHNLITSQTAVENAHPIWRLPQRSTAKNPLAG